MSVSSFICLTAKTKEHYSNNDYSKYSNNLNNSNQNNQFLTSIMLNKNYFDSQYFISSSFLYYHFITNSLIALLNSEQNFLLNELQVLFNQYYGSNSKILQEKNSISIIQDNIIQSNQSELYNQIYQKLLSNQFTKLVQDSVIDVCIYDNSISSETNIIFVDSIPNDILVQLDTTVIKKDTNKQVTQLPETTRYYENLDFESETIFDRYKYTQDKFLFMQPPSINRKSIEKTAFQDVSPEGYKISSYLDSLGQNVYLEEKFNNYELGYSYPLELNNYLSKRKEELQSKIWDSLTTDYDIKKALSKKI